MSPFTMTFKWTPDVKGLNRFLCQTFSEVFFTKKDTYKFLELQEIIIK